MNKKEIITAAKEHDLYVAEKKNLYTDNTRITELEAILNTPVESQLLFKLVENYNKKWNK